jgi:hypothetical protein
LPFLEFPAVTCLHTLLFLSCRTGRDWTRDVAWEFGMGDLTDLAKLLDRGSNVAVGALKKRQELSACIDAHVFMHACIDL